MTIDDKATEYEELRREEALKYRKPTLVQVGFCYWCKEAIKSGLFCNTECRDDWEQQQRFRL